MASNKGTHITKGLGVRHAGGDAQPRAHRIKKVRNREVGNSKLEAQSTDTMGYRPE